MTLNRKSLPGSPGRLLELWGPVLAGLSPSTGLESAATRRHQGGLGGFLFIVETVSFIVLSAPDLLS